jgi:hypothetical protein
LHFTHLTIVVSLLDKGLTLAEAEDMGGSLVLVASQEARAKAVLGDKYDPIQVKNVGKRVGHPDPQVLRVFGPPGSGSISQR